MIFFNEIYVVTAIISSIIFWRLKEKHRTPFINILCFIGLAFVQLKFTLFLLLLVVLVFFGSKFIIEKPQFKFFACLVLSLVSTLLIFKYIGRLFLLFSQSGFSRTYIVPLGVSYLVFKLIAYVADVFRGSIKEPDFMELLAFILFLPTFPAGPIDKYQNFAGCRRDSFDLDFYICGLKRLAMGYFKKVVIVNFFLNEVVLKKFYPKAMANGLDLSCGFVLLFLISGLVYACVDLSAYADIAIGFGHLFGYKICEDMDYPLLKKNLSDYWNAWHMSLSYWCRDNVFFPVLGRTRNTVLGLYCSFIVMGLWHYISLKWLLWGLWHATGVTVYIRWDRYKRKKKLMKLIPKNIAYIIGMVITVCYASLGYSFVIMESSKDALRLLGAIFL